MVEISAGQEGSSGAHGVGDGDMGHVRGEHGVAEDEGAEFAGVVGAVRVADLAREDLDEGAEDMGGIVIVLLDIFYIFVSGVDDAEACGCDDHGRVVFGVGAGIYADE